MSFSFKKGDKVALVGHNGAGKSTIFEQRENGKERTNMFRKRKMTMIIRNEYDGFMRRKEIRTYRSCLGMLKHLRKQVLKTDPWARIMQLRGHAIKLHDPWARIMQLDGVPTLVIHQTEAPGVVTVRLVDSEIET